MSNACECAEIRDELLSTPDDHAQVAVWGVRGVRGTNYIIAQWANLIAAMMDVGMRSTCRTMSLCLLLTKSSSTIH